MAAGHPIGVKRMDALDNPSFYLNGDSAYIIVMFRSEFINNIVVLLILDK